MTQQREALASGAATGATLTGRVVYLGETPPGQRRIVTKDPDVCGHATRLYERVRVGEDGALQDAVVYLDSTEIDTPWRHPEEGYVLTQKGCTFSPHVMIYPKDKKVRLHIVNADALLHNVRIFQVLGRVKSTLLNLSQPDGMPPKDKALRFKEGSNTVGIKCDVHDFMEAYIFAADNPFCTLVSQDGTFTLEGLPPGEHEIVAWHPHLGEKRQTVTITEGETEQLHFEFTLDDVKGPRVTR